MAHTLLSPPTTEAEVEAAPSARTRVRGWVIGVVVVLLAAAFGGGILTGKAMESDPIGLADDPVVALLDENISALNAGDAAAIAATFTEDAVMTDLIAGEEFVGADEIAATYASIPNWRLERTSEIVQQGAYAASGFTYRGGSGVAIFQIQDGKIAHQWVIGR